MAYVYRHVRLDTNEVFYIGIGSDPNYRRANEKCKRNEIWNRIINKTDYEVEIMLDDLTYEEAIEKEKEFIRLYGRVDKCTGTLCNMTYGGEGGLGKIMSEGQKEKLREFMKGNTYTLGYSPTEETREKLRITSTGRKHSEESKLKMSKIQKGKTVSEETKNKLSESHKGYVMPQEQKDKIRQSSIGRIKSEDEKRKLSIAGIGHIVSEETRQKISATLKNKNKLIK